MPLIIVLLAVHSANLCQCCGHAQHAANWLKTCIAAVDSAAIFIFTRLTRKRLPSSVFAQELTACGVCWACASTRPIQRQVVAQAHKRRTHAGFAQRHLTASATSSDVFADLLERQLANRRACQHLLLRVDHNLDERGQHCTNWASIIAEFLQRLAKRT